MHKEGPPQAQQPFAFTERERLYDQISDGRFQKFLAEEATHIQEVQLSNNTFGEFLFVTISHPHEGKRQSLTFFGLGFHEYRERWITETWSWYVTARNLTKAILDKQVALRHIEDRRADIAPYLTDTQPSPRARLYELLADLTDDDGALAELEDLGDDWNEA